MPGTLGSEVRDFAGDPGFPDFLVQERFDAPRDFRHGMHLARFLFFKELAEVPLGLWFAGHDYVTGEPVAAYIIGNSVRAVKMPKGFSGFIA